MKLMTFETLLDGNMYPNWIILENQNDVDAYAAVRNRVFKDMLPSHLTLEKQSMELAINAGNVVAVNDAGFFTATKINNETCRIIKEETIGAEKIAPFLEGNIFEVDSTIFCTGWFDKKIDARECMVFCYVKNGEEHKEFIHINGWEFHKKNYDQMHNFAFREATDLALKRATFLRAEKYDWCFMFGPCKHKYRYDFDQKEMFFKSSFMPHVGRFNMAYDELMRLKNEDDQLQEYSIQCDIDERNFWQDDFNMWILPDGSCIYVDWAMHERLIKFLGYNVSIKELEWIRVSGHKDYAQVYTHKYMTDAQKKTLNKLMQAHPDTYSESDALKYRKRKEEKENAKVQRL